VVGCRGGVLALRALQRKLPLGSHETRDPEVGIHGGCRLPLLASPLFPLRTVEVDGQTAGTTNRKAD